MSDSAASVAQSAQLAPWRSVLSRALHRNRSKPYSRYFQLATIHPNHRPANRTVVFRGFLRNTNALMFITDSRSQKVEDVAAYPVAEACWYFSETREQFRLAGDLLLVDAYQSDSTLCQARQQVWDKLSDKSRLQFYWPAPGQPRTADAAQFTLPTPDDSHPPDVFYLGILSPEQVDHLELRGDPQNRSRYVKKNADNWHHMEVNP